MPLRLLGKDVTVLKIGPSNTQQDVVARYQSATIELEVNLVETRAIKDAWNTQAVSYKGWRARLRTLLEASPSFPAMVAAADETAPLRLICTITNPNNPTQTWTFQGTCLPEGSTLTMEDVMTEEITLRGLGAPTIQ